MDKFLLMDERVEGRQGGLKDPNPSALDLRHLCQGLDVQDFLVQKGD